MDWRFSDAKNRLSELVRRALTDGPQRVTWRGETVIMISEAKYERLSGKKMSFVDYLVSGPSLEGVDLSRSPTPALCGALRRAGYPQRSCFVHHAKGH